MTTDEKYMREAIKQARKAAKIDEVPIGCVIVYDDKIIARGYNRRNTDKSTLAHAEIIAIDEACRTLGGWRLLECALYVTLEPCPMCCGAIINSRIDNVYFGAYDFKSGSATSVQNMFALPYNYRPEVIGGVMEDECAELLSQFFRQLREKKKKK